MILSSFTLNVKEIQTLLDFTEGRSRWEIKVESQGGGSQEVKVEGHRRSKWKVTVEGQGRKIKVEGQDGRL